MHTNSAELTMFRRTLNETGINRMCLICSFPGYMNIELHELSADG
jgi:hypothetical protein